MNKKYKTGSAILVVVLASVAFLIYSMSTNAQQEHYSILQKKYEQDIVKIYEKDIDNIEKVYNEII